MLLSGPSTIRATASALASPCATSTSVRAPRMVPSPWVRQCIGTWAGVSKNRALSARVFGASVLIRVREANDDVGSLKPMCPLAPMPRICRSTPPASAIAASYAAQAASRSSARPSGTCTRAGSRPSGSVTSRRITAAYDCGWSRGMPTYSSSAKPLTRLGSRVPARTAAASSA